MSQTNQSNELIEPPSELKTIIDNTAKYVAKNGVLFEERIKTKQTGNPKFKFLYPDDPLHPYYLFKVNEFKAFLSGTLSEKQQSEQQQQETQSVSSSGAKTGQQQGIDSDNHNNVRDAVPHRRLDGNDQDVSEKLSRSSDSRQSHDQNQNDNSQIDKVDPDEDTSKAEIKQTSGTRSRMLDEYIEEKTLKLEEPPELNFLAKPASSITLMEADIIKLTARYIATYGRNFMLDLINREHSNPIFDFTKPQHGQFTYMTNLIMQYTLIINHPLGIAEELQKDINSQKQLVDKFKMRTEWQRMLQKERKDREEIIEREKLIYSQIDWHDFVIVETIDYQPDEKGEFPPTTADQVGTRLLIQQRLEQTRVVPEEMDIDMDEDMDLETDSTQVTGDG